MKKNSQDWKNKIVVYRQMCQKILLSSPAIRYVGLINEYGRTMTGIIKQGTNPLLKAGQVRDEFFLVATLLSMRSTNYPSIGEMEFAIFKHKKVILLLFQRKEGTYYVSLDGKLSFNELEKTIFKIRKLF